MNVLGLSAFQWAFLCYPVLAALSFWGIWRVESDAARTRAELADTQRDVGLLSGRLNQLANLAVDTSDTGPIPLLDRPSPAQIAAPTRPDLEAQHPAVPATESYGRHAHRTAA